MTPVKSRARKQNLGLTISQATRDARKIVNATMPGAGATVESRYSHDLANDVPTVVTTITFPVNAPRVAELFNALADLPGRTGWNAVSTCSIVVTRKR